MDSPSIGAQIEAAFGDFGWEGAKNEDELFYIQQAFLTQRSGRRETVRELADRYDAAPRVVVGTLQLVVEDPGVCGLEVFPYGTVLCRECEPVLCDLAAASETFALNLLYRIPLMKSSWMFRLEMLKTLTERCGSLFRREDVWGLGRARAGIREPDDDGAFALLESCDCDVTRLGVLKEQWLLARGREGLKLLPEVLQKGNKNNEEQSTLSSIQLTAQMAASMDKVFQYAGGFSLPCFLEPFLSHLPAHLDKFGATLIASYHETLCRIFSRLLVDQTVRHCFLAFVENVAGQDRGRIQFDPELNVSDEFAYNCAALLLRLSEGMFRPEYEARVGTGRFPTFAFFFCARLLNGSVVRMIREGHEGIETQRANFLIGIIAPLIGKYLDFAFQVVYIHRSVVYGRVFEEWKRNKINGSNGKGLNNNIVNNTVELINNKESNTIDKESNIIDKDTIKSVNQPTTPLFNNTIEMLDGIVELVDYSPPPKDSDSLENLLSDSAWIEAILVTQEAVIRKPSDALERFLSSLFIYKNAHKSDAIRNIEVHRVSSPVLTRRLIRHYTEAKDESRHTDRYFINRILERLEIPIDYNSLRMANAIVADTESFLSASLRAIVRIKQHRARQAELEAIQAANETGDIELLSDDEEAAHPPDESMRTLVALPDAELRLAVAKYMRRHAVPPADFDSVLDNFRFAILYFTNPYLYKLKTKIMVVGGRLRGKERELKSSIAALTNILRTLKVLSVSNRKLFLNKNIFARLCTVLNGGIRDLIGPESATYKIQNKESYGYDPRALLSSILAVLLNILGVSRALVQQSGLSASILAAALAVCRARFLLSEAALLQLAAIVAMLEACAAEEQVEDVPDRFIDALTYSEMEHPVRLLTSNVVIDRSTFRQLMLNDKTDPFNRKPLTEDSCVPLPELEEEIRAFFASKS